METAAKVVVDWFSSDIDDRGTPYRHCRGCDDNKKAHTCQLCQRCLQAGHRHHDCDNVVK